MKVARDIAGITIPFTAGTALALWSGFFTCVHPCLSSSLTFAVIFASTAILLHTKHLTMTETQIRIMIGICFCSCGILSGITSGMLSAGRPYFGTFTEPVRALGAMTGEVIDSMGFRNPDTNAIIKALITGDKADIPAHIRDAFRASGASHILALSGLHLGIVYGILSKLLAVIGNSPAARTIRSLSCLVICGIYTLATGAGASIVRAFIFILLGEIARMSGRFRNISSVLMASLLIHLVIDPQALKDVGFQLSYAAMAGIAFIFPRIKDFWPEEKSRFKGPLRWTWETAALSISCQITTGPLAYLYFRSFPIHFILTNMIAIPLTGLIIPAAVLSLCMTACGWCPDILLRATEMLVTALSEALKVISLM